MDVNEGMPDRPLGQNVAGIASGIAGGLVASFLSLVMRLFEVTPFNLEAFLGSLVTRTLGIGTILLGFFIHLCISGIVGLVYAAIFRSIAHSGARIGAAVGVGHWLIAGALLGFISKIHPLTASEIPSPGFYSARLGAGAFLSFLLSYILFGATTGRTYWRALWDEQAHKSLLEVRDRAA